MTALRLCALLLAAALLAACGNRGPLYLPDQPPADTKKRGPASEQVP